MFSNTLGFFLSKKNKQSQNLLKEKAIKLKEQFIITKKDVKELRDLFIQEYDCEPYHYEKDTTFYKILSFNALHCVNNEKLNIPVEKMDFKIYKMIDIEKYKSNDDMPTYVAFEMNTGYIDSNCNRLFLKLMVEKGINQENIDNFDNLFCEYLEYLVEYNEIVN